ncbi:hypothetical protein DDZ13_02280 [Coraliomargarita sinensis]|uniref:Uncharacterized protein n=1 Tax=Coraliomargarita sinensis TaxID=2174842 RepID=A0A317ZPD1_9BACT|nr:hypothetical protein [Coraliomargarita sinensis]PXA05719.1 hypothetical protein DDZ13_02280 [Coraliomargarita sinensis]
MGTSTNYSASPNWKDAKKQVTQAGGEGFVTPEKAASLISTLVSQMAKESSLGFGSPSGGGGSGGAGGSGGGGSRGGTGVGRSTRASGGSIRNVARGVGSFLSEVQQKGFEQALADHGLTDLSDKSPYEIALELADILYEPASLIDDNILRDALIDMMMEWSEGQDSFEDLSANFEEASSDINGVLHELMGHYIYQVFKSVGYQGVLNTHGFEAAESMCGQIRDYIDARVSDFESTRNLSSVAWNGQEGADVVDGIVSDTLDLFGGDE